jgi:hypothetical protein
LFEQQDARWLMIGGSSPSEEGQRGSAPAGEFVKAVDLPLLRIQTATAGAPMLRLVGEGAGRLDLPALRGVLPDLRLTFGRTDAEASELALPPAAVQRLLAQLPVTAIMPTPQRFTKAELAFIRFDVLDPLLAGGVRSMPAAAAAAAALGIQLGRVIGPDGEPLVGLRRAGHPAQLYLLRPGGSGPVLQLAADEGLASVGANLFRQLNSRALLVVPDRYSLDGEGAQLLPLIAQALIGRAPEGTATIQLRQRPAFVGEPGALLALDRIEPAGGFGDRLLASLGQAGIAARLVDGGPDTAGLEIGPAAHLRYLQQAHGGRVALLWLDSAP